MKNVRLIDALPTVFGVIALVGYAVFRVFNPNSNPGPAGTLGPMLLIGGGVAALLTALLSVVTAIMKNKFQRVHYVNLLWIALPGLFFAWVGYIALTYG
jgi:hypothetical protein